MMGYKANKVDHIQNIPLPIVANWNTGEQEPDYCVVGGAHAFILKVSSYFGLAPLRFVPHSNGFKISFSKSKCIYSYILITILATLTILGNAAETSQGLKSAIQMAFKTMQVVFTCQVFIVVITAGAGVYGASKRMKNLLRCMNRLASVDKNVGGPNSLKNERKFHVFVLAMLPMSLILLVYDYSSLIYSLKKSDRLWDAVVNYTGYYMVWHVVFFLEMQFAFVAQAVRARIAAINDALAVEARQVSNTVLNDPRLATRLHESIQRIATSYGIVCDVVQEINDTHGLLLVVIFSSILINLIIPFYFFITEIIMSTNHVGFCVAQALWCVFNVLRAIVIVDSCHKTVQGKRRTEWLMCRLMNYGHPEESLSVRLQLFSKQLMLWSVSYSPLGMFTLDRPILTSAIGAITTYLVILIQFQITDN